MENAIAGILLLIGAVLVGCCGSTAESSVADPEILALCAAKPAPEGDACLDRFAKLNCNAEYCERISAQETKDDCRTVLGSLFCSADICKRVEDPAKKEQCLARALNARCYQRC